MDTTPRRKLALVAGEQLSAAFDSRLDWRNVCTAAIADMSAQSPGTVSAPDAYRSRVLEIVSDYSVAPLHRRTGINRLLNSVVQNFTGPIAIGNLSYDPILEACLVQNHGPSFCDMADARSEGDHGLRMPDGSSPVAWKLRDKPEDFPSTRRIIGVHLNGAITYWGDGTGDVFKLDTYTVRNSGLWAAMRAGTTALGPYVALPNQYGKTSLVTEHPYSLAYEMFDRGLQASSNWLLIGCSFQDVSVNNMLKAAFARKMILRPKVLVVTDDLSVTRTRVESAFGWNHWRDGRSDWLTIRYGSLYSMVDSAEWQAFSGAEIALPVNSLLADH